MKLEIRQIDAFEINADILVLKHAQGLYGLDAAVVDKLQVIHSNIEEVLPSEGKEFLIESKPIENFKKILFIGVVTLFDFKYLEIREFVKRALTKINKISPSPETIVFTLHGKGYGLDIEEAFRAELNGVKDAINQNVINSKLKTIIFIERTEEIAIKLNRVLNLFLKENQLIFPSRLSHLNEETFGLLSIALSEKINNLPSSRNHGIKKIISALSQEDKDGVVLKLVSKIYDKLLCLENEINEIQLDKIDPIDFMFLKLNPVYLETQLLCQKISDKNYKEIAWICQIHVMNYLIAICDKKKLTTSFFIAHKEKIKNLVKASFLNFWGSRLILSNKFPWRRVDEVLKTNNIKKYWDEFDNLSKILND